MGLLKEVEQKAKELEAVKQEVIKKIALECSKYENKTITYISKKPRIYVINFSDLQNNWSPEYYDFEYQFKVIIYILKHTNADNLINKWETMKKDGIAKFLPSIVTEYNMKNPYADIAKSLEEDWYDTNYKIIKFHPKVVEFMDNLLLG